MDRLKPPVLKGFHQDKGRIPCRLQLRKRPYPADFELEEGRRFCKKGPSETTGFTAFPRRKKQNPLQT
eukprot:1664692-Amphidinium_carterae.1